MQKVERIGINTTDLHSLNLIAVSKRDVSAGDLARLTGLTTASITTVIDRLGAPAW
jgi:DNA-binding MarR family transcriptional regulator